MDHNADRPCPDTAEAAPRAAAHGTAARRGVRALLPVAAAALLAAGACGAPEEDSEAAGSGGAQHNDADVMFAQMMIPHHEQALEMADLAEDRSGPEVGDLAAEIAEAQGPEIEQLTGMLASWGEDPEGGDHDGHSMDGMLSDDQMAELEAADGAEFDALFTAFMIEHHEGAVDMAEAQIEDGSDPEATELAEEIVAAQEDEIAQMEDLQEGSVGTPDGGSGDSGDSGGGDSGGSEEGGGHGGH
ncbi:DUF305 domain-containing protein [Nocardiopsis coralliicola]